MIFQLDNQGETWFTKTFSADNVALTMEFKWAEEVEKIYNNLLNYIKNMEKSRPLSVSGNHVREYDIIGFLRDNNTFEKYEASPIKFASPLSRDKFEELLLEVDSINTELLSLEEQLVWSFTCSDTNGVSYTGTVRTGSWFNKTTGTYKFRFLGDGIGDQIGKDDLWRVSMEVE